MSIFKINHLILFCSLYIYLTFINIYCICALDIQKPVLFAEVVWRILLIDYLLYFSLNYDNNK